MLDSVAADDEVECTVAERKARVEVDRKKGNVARYESVRPQVCGTHLVPQAVEGFRKQSCAARRIECPTRRQIFDPLQQDLEGPAAAVLRNADLVEQLGVFPGGHSWRVL